MIRFLERIRLAMLDAQTPREAIEHYHSMRHEKVAQRMKRYGLEM
jgi:predicted subunit of tRNA(5-methylaminomethyl-2-thiouridylate) methyltransferase